MQILYIKNCESINGILETAKQETFFDIILPEQYKNNISLENLLILILLFIIYNLFPSHFPSNFLFSLKPLFNIIYFTCYWKNIIINKINNKRFHLFKIIFLPKKKK